MEALASASVLGCADTAAEPLDRAPEIIAALVPDIEGTEVLPLRRALGRVLREEVSSPIALPSFDHSAVDGYGIRTRDVLAPQTPLPVVARILAGESSEVALEGAAVHIMTGAPVPSGCDAVVKQEHVVRHGESITLTDLVRHDANIRRAGEDVCRGERIIPSGTVLDTRHIALLAACGVASVRVARRVRIAIAAFGSELRSPGMAIDGGQIFDSNTAMATAFLDKPSCRVGDTVRSGDDCGHATKLLRELSAEHDMIVTSGGMAHGDKDYTTRALENAGGRWRETAFAMKPGKPARVGCIRESVVLGLPGNPFAALVALLVLGRPMIDALTGSSSRAKWLPASAAFDLERSAGKTEFFPAGIVKDAGDSCLTVERLGKGGSARLHPLVHADGLGRIDARTASVTRADTLHFLPFSAMFA